MTHSSCIRCYISGKVQGVWYRTSAQKEAQQLGINGWARNLDDGRVEVFACGSIETLDILYEWLKKGPQLARVVDCTREELPWEELDDFDVL